MPSRWLPCPLKTTASRPPDSARPVNTPAADRPSANARSRETASVRPSATTAARLGSWARPPTNDQPTSTNRTSDLAELSKVSAIRAAWARNASSPAADNSSGTTAGSGPRSTGSSPLGACSRMMCAFVPLIPKDETAARRTRSRDGHSRARSSSSTPPEAQSTWDEGVAECRLRGSTPARIAMIILMRPAAPAAACVCPMFDLTDPSHNGRSSGRC